MARWDVKPEEVVRLWLDEELSLKEIAQHYGVGTTTVKNRLNQVRAQMGDERWKERKQERVDRRRARREERAREAYRLRAQVSKEEEST